MQAQLDEEEATAPLEDVEVSVDEARASQDTEKNTFHEKLCVCVLFFVVLVGSKIMSKVYIFIFVYSPKTGKACLFSAPLQALGFDTTIYVYLICVCLYMYIHICMVSYV